MISRSQTFFYFFILSVFLFAGSGRAAEQNDFPALLPVPSETGSAGNESHVGDVVESVGQEIPNDEDLRLVDVRYKAYTLAQTLVIYENTGGGYLPLSEMSKALDIALTVDMENGVAEGFIFNQDKIFYLDVPAGLVTIAGREKKIKKDLAKFYQDDIYVDSRLMGEWFDVIFDVDYFAGMLFVKTDQVLPFEAKLEREKKINKMKARFQKRDFGYPDIESPYELWSVPNLDQTMRLTSNKVRSAEPTLNLAYTGYVTAEFMRMQTSAYLDANNAEGLGDFRWQMGRTDPNAALLGVARARQFQFGIINSMNVPMVMRSGVYGYGGMLSNYPLGRQIEYDKQSFTGDLLPGWEVELYHNNSLVGFQQSKSDGLYQFDNIPLLFGNNYFRLVFYGPQGQLREENKQYYLGTSLTRPGQQYYQSMYNYEPELDEHRAAFNYEIGINKNLSGALRASMIPLNNKSHAYVSAGLNSFYGPFFFQSDMSLDVSGGFGAELGMQTRLGPFNFSLRHSELIDFVSESWILYADPLIRQEYGGIHTAIPATPFSYRIPISFEGYRYQHESGFYRYDMINRVSSLVFGAYFSHELKFSGSQLGATQNTGYALLSRYLGFASLRSEYNYEFTDGFQSRDMSLSLEGQLYNSYRYSLKLTRQLLRDAYEVSAGINGIFSNQSLRIDMGYATDNTISVSAALAMGSAYDPRGRRWEYSASPIADTGAVSMKVFVDKNSNGVFDPLDEPIKGASFHVNGYPDFKFTDDKGVVFLTRLPVKQYVQLGIKEDSLEDPLWVPQREGIKVLLRPGRVMQFDFPVTMTGEIDGMTFIQRRGETKETGEVLLQLLDAAGVVVQSTKSAYDGFYIFTRVPIGEYSVRVAPEQVSRLSLKKPKEQKLVLNNDDVFRSGVDFVY